MAGSDVGHDLGQAAPDSIQAAINAPSCACVPGAGSRVPPGIQPQPTSESCAICSWIAASVLPPLRRGSLICSQSWPSDFVCHAIDFGATCHIGCPGTLEGS